MKKQIVQWWKRNYSLIFPLNNYLILFFHLRVTGVTNRNMSKKYPSCNFWSYLKQYAIFLNSVKRSLFLDNLARTPEKISTKEEVFILLWKEKVKICEGQKFWSKKIMIFTRFFRKKKKDFHLKTLLKALRS